MKNSISKVVWTRNARESLNKILDYIYLKIPEARKIVRTDIINASKKIKFPEQYPKDSILSDYRWIIVRDYKIIYSFDKTTIYVLDVICTKAN